MDTIMQIVIRDQGSRDVFAAEIQMALQAMSVAGMNAVRVVQLGSGAVAVIGRRQPLPRDVRDKEDDDDEPNRGFTLPQTWELLDRAMRAGASRRSTELEVAISRAALALACHWEPRLIRAVHDELERFFLRWLPSFRHDAPLARSDLVLLSVLDALRSFRPPPTS